VAVGESFEIDAEVGDLEHAMAREAALVRCEQEYDCTLSTIGAFFRIAPRKSLGREDEM
jgi:hypothetical protein